MQPSHLFQSIDDAADRRAGSKSILAGRRTFKTWGDVEAACQNKGKLDELILLWKDHAKEVGVVLPATVIQLDD
jgi:hypothetical protein